MIGKEQIADVVHYLSLTDAKANMQPYYQPRVKENGEWVKRVLTGNDAVNYGSISGKIYGIKSKSYEWKGDNVLTFELTIKDNVNGKDEAYILTHSMNSLSRRILDLLHGKDLRQGDSISINVSKGKDAAENGDVYPSVFVQLNGEWLKSGVSKEDKEGYIETYTLKGKQLKDYDKLDKDFYHGTVIPKISEKLSVGEIEKELSESFDSASDFDSGEDGLPF